MEISFWYEESMENEQTVFECCGEPVVECVTCGADTPTHTVCRKCHVLVERLGEDVFQGRSEAAVSTAQDLVEAYGLRKPDVFAQEKCDLCGGRGSHAGVVGQYACRLCSGTGKLGVNVAVK